MPESNIRFEAQGLHPTERRDGALISHDDQPFDAWVITRKSDADDRRYPITRHVASVHVSEAGLWNAEQIANLIADVLNAEAGTRNP